ncbi:apyrase-like isoform X2 [Trichoplusia ni]|uniref:apyrase n=1 Tax=Trichoplusia ni TaxID=7111 RepID=A0A7E5W4W8_TRINI|nr:apyrase-like isoform X2 [Trichoplusia ni]
MLLIFLFSCAAIVNGQSSGRFPLNILHYNDFHARFVETNPWSSVCNPASGVPCIGGFARLATMVRERMKAEPKSLLLNGGDSFQGTIWYNLLRWNVTQDFMNMLPHDAHVLGNHEFDNGIAGVVPYLEHLDSTVVTANIIDDLEPTIQGLYKKSTIVERDGRRIGIIGVIISSTNVLASTGQLKFTDEVETVREEAEKLNAQGVNIIIVLSHCGIDIDREIAEHGGPYIDIIVGGHSHTLLFNGDVPPNTQFVPLGPYPVVVEQPTRKVLIVQAAAHTQYLGEIKLFFDDQGNLLDWEGNPHYLGNEVAQAPDVLEKINYYLPLIEEQANQEIGYSMVYLSSSCACQECNLGNLICDSYLHAALKKAENNQWNGAHFCVINQGGIRTDIDKGLLTYESVLATTPFENNIEAFDLKGVHVKEMLEFGVANDPFPGARMLQTSGLRVVYDGAKPLGNRVLNVTIRCIECDVPRYDPLDTEKYYRVVTTDFIGNGGGDYTMLSENRKNIEGLGADYAIFMDYINQMSPVFVEIDGRVTISNACT